MAVDISCFLTTAFGLCLPLLSNSYSLDLSLLKLLLRKSLRLVICKLSTNRRAYINTNTLLIFVLRKPTLLLDLSI